MAIGNRGEAELDVVRRDWSAWQVVWMFVVILVEFTVSQGGEGSNFKQEIGEGRENASQGSADGRSMVECRSDR